jgi:hypothetical protein
MSAEKTAVTDGGYMRGKTALIERRYSRGHAGGYKGVTETTRILLD